MDEKTIDRTAMGKLAGALSFICGATHPVTAALKKASETGDAKDIKAARAQFLKLKSSERAAAMTMLQD
jgi:hypothetical protein